MISYILGIAPELICWICRASGQLTKAIACKSNFKLEPYSYFNMVFFFIFSILLFHISISLFHISILLFHISILLHPGTPVFFAEPLSANIDINISLPLFYQIFILAHDCIYAPNYFDIDNDIYVIARSCKYIHQPKPLQSSVDFVTNINQKIYPTDVLMTCFSPM